MPLNFNSNNVTSVNFNGTPVTKINFNGVEVWSSAPAPTVLEPFYIENSSNEDSITISLSKRTASAPDVYLEYSSDGGTTWSTFTQDTNYTLPASGKFSFRAPQGTPNSSFATSIANCNVFVGSNRFKAGGDITTLLEKDGNITDLTNYGTYTFCGLFRDFNNSTPAILSDCANLVLPSTTLQGYCYRNLFYNCNNITSAPTLPATTLATECYCYMFYACGGLTTPPALSATTLATGCYKAMFQNSGITSAPTLPATTLQNDCYKGMFQDCTSLTTPPALPATTLASSCYEYMFSSSWITSAPTLPATNLEQSCYKAMFLGCIHLTSGPDLPATTLANQCYREMFFGSTVSSVKVYFTAWGTSTYNWFQSNSQAQGTFYCPSALGDDSTITRGVSNCPTNWTVINI